MTFVTGVHNIKRDQCCEGCGKDGDCRVTIAVSENQFPIVLTSIVKNGGSPIAIGVTVNNFSELIAAINTATGETFAVDGNGIIAFSSDTYTLLVNNKSLAIQTVCPEFTYCISREDAGGDIALETIQDDYGTTRITRKVYLNGKSYYELISNSATPPAAEGEDNIGSNSCFEGTSDAPPPAGEGAEATAVMDDDEVDTVTVDEGGSGYIDPQVSFTGGGGAGAAATATVVDGVITAIVVTNGGSSYETTPTVVITDAQGDGN